MCTQDIEFERCWSGRCTLCLVFGSFIKWDHWFHFFSLNLYRRRCSWCQRCHCSHSHYYCSTYVIPITIKPTSAASAATAANFFSLFLLAVHIKMHSSKHWEAHVSKVIALKSTHSSTAAVAAASAAIGSSANRKVQLNILMSMTT